jgi:DNA-binding helix-hairpin-helix protein with protein kinase domain
MHWYHADLKSCPWCQMEAASGLPLFSDVLSPAAAAYFDLDSFWPTVAAMLHPGPAPALEEVEPFPRRIRPSAEAAAFQRRRWFHVPLAVLAAALPLWVGAFSQLPSLARLFFFFAALAIYVLIRRVLKSSIDISAFRDRERRQYLWWEQVRSDWESRAGPRRFDQKRTELERLRREWQGLSNLRESRLGSVANHRGDIQLARYLDTAELGQAEIENINAGRKSYLQSFGIETAADVTEARLQAVPGISLKVRDSLVAWRRSLEAGFNYDASLSIDGEDRRSVEQDILAQRLRIGLAVREGYAELQQISRRIQLARTNLRRRGEDAYLAYLQAQADLRAVMP